MYEKLKDFVIDKYIDYIEDVNCGKDLTPGEYEEVFVPYLLKECPELEGIEIGGVQ